MPLSQLFRRQAPSGVPEDLHRSQRTQALLGMAHHLGAAPNLMQGITGGLLTGGEMYGQGISQYLQAQQEAEEEAERQRQLQEALQSYNVHPGLMHDPQMAQVAMRQQEHAAGQERAAAEAERERQQLEGLAAALTGEGLHGGLAHAPQVASTLLNVRDRAAGRRHQDPIQFRDPRTGQVALLDPATGQPQWTYGPEATEESRWQLKQSGSRFFLYDPVTHETRPLRLEGTDEEQRLRLVQMLIGQTPRQITPEVLEQIHGQAGTILEMVRDASKRNPDEVPAGYMPRTPPPNPRRSARAQDAAKKFGVGGQEVGGAIRMPEAGYAFPSQTRQGDTTVGREGRLPPTRQQAQQIVNRLPERVRARLRELGNQADLLGAIEEDLRFRDAESVYRDLLAAYEE